MNKTRIDWCDSTWNPVTGCLHGCEYCYARNISERFKARELGEFGEEKVNGNYIYELNSPLLQRTSNGACMKSAYPYGFAPTLHRYRLNDYIGKQGRNIFVCSMADLFGKWVPDSWIEEVFNVCKKAPQHNYLFLTKNPKRYEELGEKGMLPDSPNMWFGFSQTETINKSLYIPAGNIFVSVEPILKETRPYLTDWVIVGAETGRRENKVIPKREWIEQIVEDCRKYGIPIFMKSSLADIWGEPLIQEFPKELKR